MRSLDRPLKSLLVGVDRKWQAARLKGAVGPRADIAERLEICLILRLAFPADSVSAATSAGENMVDALDRDVSS
jgi:hypothetical protein